MSHVFVSYSTRNADYAHGLAGSLRQHGFDVWIDNDRLRSGDDWWRQIVQALRTCAAFVVVLTPESDQSRWVQREITLADNWNKPMHPLLLAGDINTDNFLIFVRTQYEDVRHGNLPSDAFWHRLRQHVQPGSGIGQDLTGQSFNVPVDNNPVISQVIDSSPAQPFAFNPVGTWQAQIQNMGIGMVAKGSFIFYPQQTFAARIQNAMSFVDVQGTWQLNGNQLMLQGMQWSVTMPYNQIPYGTLLMINDASPVMFRGSTSGGEVFVCQRTG